MMIKKLQTPKSLLSEMVKAMMLIKGEIQELQQKEELYYTFIHLTPSMPSEEESKHYNSLPIHRMNHINDLLKAGFKLDEIKGYTIWKGKQ